MTEKEEVVTVRLSERLYGELEAYAETQGMSMAEAIRGVLREELRGGDELEELIEVVSDLDEDVRKLEVRVSGLEESVTGSFFDRLR